MKSAKKPQKLTKSQACHQEIRNTVKGRDGKAALDDFVSAVDALVDSFGKKDAMQLYVRCGMLITMAKEEAK